MKLTLREVIICIKNDLPQGRFSIKTFLTNYLFSARFRVLLNYRLGRYFYHSGNYFLRQLALRYRYRMITRRGCDISYNALIGKNLRLPHPIGIVIGDNVEIKDNVTILQQVTIGNLGRKNEIKRYPILEDGVTIFAGAKIVGGICIGKNSVIGANSFVNKNIPPNSVAVGVPCQIKTKK